MIKFLKKYWAILILVLLIDVFLLTICFMPANKEIIAPGALTEVESFIEIDEKTDISGSFSTIYVYSYEKPTVFQTFIAGISSFNQISNTNSYYDLTTEENRKSGLIQKEQSIQSSLICAYENANLINNEIHIAYEFSGYIVYLCQINQQVLKIGDLIYRVDKLLNDGSFVNIEKNVNELKIALNSLEIGDIIYYKRDGKLYHFVINELLDFEIKKNAFTTYAYYEIDKNNTYPQYEILPTKTLGPSGGLLQTLSIYSQITGIDLTKGRKISGTGMIYANGTVGAIGGIKQKVYTALKNKVDVFLCPKANFEDAYLMWESIKGHERMQLVEVSTFDEAIKYLGGNSNV